METRLPPLSLFPWSTQKLQSWEKQFLDPPVLVSSRLCSSTARKSLQYWSLVASSFRLCRSMCNGLLSRGTSSLGKENFHVDYLNPSLIDDHRHFYEHLAHGYHHHQIIIMTINIITIITFLMIMHSQEQTIKTIRRWITITAANGLTYIKTPQSKPLLCSRQYSEI